MPNELLNVLTQRGQVTHFVEKIPSVNDIFYQNRERKVNYNL
jgi:ABC-2 type transport system ATP-binding protein